MQKEQVEKHKFGLIGRHISYSFSRKYFTEKFERLHLTQYEYVNFDLQQIEEFPNILAAEKFIKGFNVTIPYKEQIIDYLDELDATAEEIGAVNTIKVLKGGRLKGYNTDAYGFEQSLLPNLKKHHTKALILGTGGASKAVKFVFDQLKIDMLFVSRKPKRLQEIGYDQLTQSIIESHFIIVNCTPVGTYPQTEEHPQLPYQHITENHLLYDLIYNPTKTTFLTLGKKRGAAVVNGLRMLELQAEEAWRIWNL